MAKITKICSFFHKIVFVWSILTRKLAILSSQGGAYANRILPADLRHFLLLIILPTIFFIKSLNYNYSEHNVQKILLLYGTSYIIHYHVDHISIKSLSPKPLKVLIQPFVLKNDKNKQTFWVKFNQHLENQNRGHNVIWNDWVWHNEQLFHSSSPVMIIIWHSYRITTV